MKKLFVILLGITLLIGCSKEEKKTDNLPAGVHGAVVKESIPTENYTYFRVEENGQEYWIATNRMEVPVGEKVYYSQAMEMKNFHSKALNRDFESILFVQGASATPPNATMDEKKMPEGHPQITKGNDVEVKKIDLPSGFISIADLYKKEKSLEGKTVKVKGTVVKFNKQIMNRNWIHIQDGTNYEGKSDLLITSQDEAKVGDVVSFEGTVVVNKDFGAGYKYELLLEKAKMVK